MNPEPIESLIYMQTEDTGALFFMKAGVAASDSIAASGLLPADGKQGFNYQYLGTVFNVPNLPCNIIFFREFRSDGAQRDICIQIPRIGDDILFPPPEGLYTVYLVNDYNYNAGVRVLPSDSKIAKLPAEWEPVYQQWCQHLQQYNTTYVPVFLQHVAVPVPVTVPVPVPVPVYVHPPVLLSQPNITVASAPAIEPPPAKAVVPMSITKPAPAASVVASSATPDTGSSISALVTHATGRSLPETNKVTVQVQKALTTNATRGSRTTTEGSQLPMVTTLSATRVTETEIKISKSSDELIQAVTFFNPSDPQRFIRELVGICIKNPPFAKLIAVHLKSFNLSIEQLFAVFTNPINELEVNELTANIYTAIITKFFEMNASNPDALNTKDPRDYPWLGIKTNLLRLVSADANLKAKVEGFCQSRIDAATVMPAKEKPLVAAKARPQNLATAMRAMRAAAERAAATATSRAIQAQRAAAANKAAIAKSQAAANRAAAAKADAVALDEAVKAAAASTPKAKQTPKSEFDELSEKIESGKFGLRDLQALQKLKADNKLFKQKDDKGEILLMKLLRCKNNLSAKHYGELIDMLITNAGAEIVAKDLAGQSVLHHWAKADMSGQSEMYSRIFEKLYNKFHENLPQNIQDSVKAIDYEPVIDFVTDNNGATFLHLLINKKDIVMLQKVLDALYKCLESGNINESFPRNIMVPLIIAKHDGKNLYNMLEKQFIDSKLDNKPLDQKIVDDCFSTIINTYITIGYKFQSVLQDAKQNPALKDNFCGFTVHLMDVFDFQSQDNNFEALLNMADPNNPAKNKKILEIINTLIGLRNRARTDLVNPKFPIYMTNDILAVLMHAQYDADYAQRLLENWKLINPNDDKLIARLYTSATTFVPLHLRYGIHVLYDIASDEERAFKLLQMIIDAFGSHKVEMWNYAVCMGIKTYLFGGIDNSTYYSDFLSNYLSGNIDLQIVATGKTFLFGLVVELKEICEHLIKLNENNVSSLSERLGTFLKIIFDKQRIDIVEAAVNTKNADGKLFYEVFANQQLGAAVKQFVSEYLDKRRLDEAGAAAPAALPRNTP
jgi:hypothetical protein